jgi:CxxC motif-containing protein (DUF1111 family)
MFLMPNPKYIERLARLFQSTSETRNSPGSRTRSFVVWALIALAPTLAAGWFAAERLRPRQGIDVGSGMGLALIVREVHPADVDTPVMSPASSPQPEVATPARSVTATCAVESHDPTPTPKQPNPPEPKPDVAPTPAATVARPTPAEQIALGRALFDRKWRPDDPRCHGGDGLGPVFNATSCLECHSGGGPGGGGPVRTNAELMTVIGVAHPKPGVRTFDSSGNELKYVVRAFPGHQISAAAQAALVNLHPGFTEAPSTVLHRFGVDTGYQWWREKLSIQLHSLPLEVEAPPKSFQGGLLDAVSDQTQVVLTLTQRNPTPLFGAGQIDALSDQTLLELASKSLRLPAFQGRLPRDRSGKVGRFGWKGQTATLRDFVLTACANELGLEVTGHHQAASPLAPDSKPKGLDMTEEECDALVAYVRNLPAPAVVEPSGSSAMTSILEGRWTFIEIGCADCHTPDLGSVQGIYSDLLLHEMGEALADPGVYYGNSASPSAARSTEWRTPPLWGVRDSGPYMHDGRAETLEEVVSLHGGQAALSARKFTALNPRGRSLLKAFLNTLVAPAPDELADDAAQDARPRRAEITPVEAAKRAKARLQLGHSLERKGKIGNAVDCYREIVKEAPDSPSAKTAASRITALTASAANPVPSAVSDSKQP